MWNIIKIVRKIKSGLMKQIYMVGFSGTLDTGQVGDLQMIKDMLIDRKDMLVGLKVNKLK